MWLEGFDAHDDDPLASCELIEDDYRWVTEAILASCSRINPLNPPKCPLHPFSTLQFLIIVWKTVVFYLKVSLFWKEGTT